jgi:hypothetical protein
MTEGTIRRVWNSWAKADGDKNTQEYENKVHMKAGK